MPEVPDLRVSDAEREQTADRLRAAAGEGRLEAAELDERLTRAFSAVTQSELTALTADLPAPAEPAAPLAPLSPERHPLGSRLLQLAVPNVVCIAVWAATGAGTFWPIWVLVGTGIGAVTMIVRHLTGADDDDDGPWLPPPPRPPGPPRL
jgi:hypothetical protein